MSSHKPQVAFVDAEDSFTWNIVDSLVRSGAEVRVHSFRESPEEVSFPGSYTHLVLGPGPGTPQRAGLFETWLQTANRETPVLGVCLGMQAIAVHYGAAIARLHPVHGYPAEVRHCGRGLFKGLPDPMTVGRYHSLGFYQASLSSALEVHASSSGGLIMAIRVKGKPIYGVQFHPESVLSPLGDRLLSNFLALNPHQPWTVGATPLGSITSAS